MDNTQMFLETELISTFSKDQRMLWNLIKKYQKNQDEQWRWGSPVSGPYIAGEASEMKCDQSALTSKEGKAVDMNFSQNFVDSAKGLYFAGVDPYWNDCLNSGIITFKSTGMTTEQKIEVMRMAVGTTHMAPFDVIEMYYNMMEAFGVQVVDQNTSSNEYYGQEVKKMSTKITE